MFEKSNDIVSQNWRICITSKEGWKGEEEGRGIKGRKVKKVRELSCQGPVERREQEEERWNR